LLVIVAKYDIKKEGTLKTNMTDKGGDENGKIEKKYKR
jgi:hypothetical protein